MFCVYAVRDRHVNDTRKVKLFFIGYCLSFERKIVANRQEKEGGRRFNGAVSVRPEEEVLVFSISSMGVRQVGDACSEKRHKVGSATKL